MVWHKQQSWEHNDTFCNTQRGVGLTVKTGKTAGASSWTRIGARKDAPRVSFYVCRKRSGSGRALLLFTQFQFCVLDGDHLHLEE